MSKDSGSSSWEVLQNVAKPMFNIVLFPEDFTSKVAKSSYGNKHSHAQAFIESNWKMTVEAAGAANRTAPFNGEKAIAYIKPGTDDDSVFKVVPSDYANLLASAKKTDAVQDPDGMRKHFVMGIIIVCVTKDNEVIVGSRDANWDKTNPESLMGQFSAGFIDPNEAFYAQASTVSGLKQAFRDTALKELREEVFEFPAETITETKLLGGITQLRMWPSKRSGNKAIENVKSVIVQVDVNMSAAEIMRARETNPPEDFHEMTVMTAMPFDDMVQMKDAPSVFLEGSPREFIAEHAVVPSVIAAARAREEQRGSSYVSR